MSDVGANLFYGQIAENYDFAVLHRCDKIAKNTLHRARSTAAGTIMDESGDQYDQDDDCYAGATFPSGQRIRYHNSPRKRCARLT